MATTIAPDTPTGSPLVREERSFPNPFAETNQFLFSLTSESRAILLDRATRVELPFGTVLYEANEKPDYAHFLASGVASVEVATKGQANVGVGLIGREGIVGTLSLLGDGENPGRCSVLLEATAVRIAFSEFESAFNRSEEIRKRILNFVKAQSVGTSLLVVCHRCHEANARLARSLLMMRDMTQSENLFVTQQSLAALLGSQRTTVTAAINGFERRGIIECNRGRVTIVNRDQLVAAACGCYPVMTRLCASLYK
jgi:CRP-like cAMP-binding protein